MEELRRNNHAGRIMKRAIRTQKKKGGGVYAKTNIS